MRLKIGFLVVLSALGLVACGGSSKNDSTMKPAPAASPDGGTMAPAADGTATPPAGNPCGK